MKVKKTVSRKAFYITVCSILLIAALGVSVSNILLNRTIRAHGMKIYPPHEGYGKVIYIQPLGEIDNDTLSTLKDSLIADFKHQVKILPSFPVPYFPEGRAYQVKADFLRNHISKHIGFPKDTFRIIGITNEDLYAEGYNFIFGQASMGGLISVISVKRLMPALDGGELINDPDGECRKLYHQRIRKLARHELGHTFGLLHCDDPSCVMAFHASLDELDEGGEFFCDKCLQKLAEAGIKLE